MNQLTDAAAICGIANGEGISHDHDRDHDTEMTRDIPLVVCTDRSMSQRKLRFIASSLACIWDSTAVCYLLCLGLAATETGGGASCHAGGPKSVTCQHAHECGLSGAVGS